MAHTEEGLLRSLRALPRPVCAWSPTGLWQICGAVSVISAALIVRLPGRRITEPFVEPPDVGPEVPGAER